MRDALAPIVRNLWLLVRLCIFAYFFFSSGRGYGRLLILAILGSIVWAVQQGFLGARLNNQLNRVRDHFAEVADEARGRVAGGVGTEEERVRAVNRAQGQRRRVRDSLRQVERTIALCFASLWPGVGEAVVRNHEQARRAAEAAAAAAEDARKAEEEKRRLEQEGQGQAESSKIADKDGGREGSSGAQIEGSEGVERVNKGKERATDATDVE
jgi:regulator of protease activity HflC (stomatin/prohibitin superfamily)